MIWHHRSRSFIEKNSFFLISNLNQSHGLNLTFIGGNFKSILKINNPNSLTSIVECHKDLS